MKGNKMAETPFTNLSNTFRDKIIPKLTRNDTNDADEVEEYDVLDRLNIPIVIPLSDETLTPSINKSILFNEQRVGGFNVKEVEKYHRRVNLTLKELLDALELRNQHVTRLASEIDKYQTDLTNKVIELQAIETLGGIPLRGDDGSYVRESDLNEDQRNIISLENTIAEKAALEKVLESKNAELNREIENLKTKNSEVIAHITALQKDNERLQSENVPVDENHPNIVAYIKWVDQVREEYDRITKELKETKHNYTLLQAQLTESKVENTGRDVENKNIEQLKANFAQSEANNAQLRNNIESLTEQLREMTENYSLSQKNQENKERIAQEFADLESKLQNETQRGNQEIQLRNQLENQLIEIQNNANEQIKNIQDAYAVAVQERDSTSAAYTELHENYQILRTTYEEAADVVKSAAMTQTHYQEATNTIRDLQEENSRLRSNLAGNVTEDIDPTMYTASGEARGSGRFVLPEGVSEDDI